MFGLAGSSSFGQNPQDELGILTFRLVHHSRFGDLDEAHRIATTMLRISESVPATRAADLQRKSAMTFWLAGDVDRALEVLTLAQTNARANGLSRLETRIALPLYDWLRSVGLDDAAEKVVKKLDELETEIPDAHLDLIIVTAYAEKALLRGSMADAQKWLTVAADSLPTDPAWRICRFHAALSTRLQYVERGPPRDLEAAIATLLRYHKPGHELGDASDLEIALAVQLLYEDGQLDRSKQILQRYVDLFRRSRSPHAAWLREAESLVGWIPTSRPETNAPAAARLQNTQVAYRPVAAD